MSLSTVEERVRRLPKTEQAPVEDRIARLAEALLDRREAVIGYEPDQFEALLALILRVITATSAEASATRVIELPSELAGRHDDPTLAELEKRNAELAQSRWARGKRESFRSSELQERLGVSRQRLSQVRKEGKIVGFKTPLDRETYFPAWQFGADGALLEAIPQIAAAAKEAGLDELSLHQLMVNEDASPAGPLMLLLREGKLDYVLDAIRAANAQGS